MDVAETAAQVELTLSDGSRRTGRHDILAKMPMGQRQRKILDKVAGLTGEARSKRLWAAIEAGPDLAALLAVLTD